ncbi:MAG: tRNA (adenosine(37)-N6)-dimethylallyltransferase MiaA [Clostridia bacterium]|nr:tRNA (adenosine(37)-N6)-dimethylallyltransferase MiaA [Clostridia bacterium]
MKKSIVIFGPTATGKSKYSVMLAEKIDAQIISFDSMQVYIGSDIASAKPEKNLLNRVKHHLISVYDDDKPYTAGLFKKDALEIISQIENEGKRVVLTGGTGLYIDSLICDIDFENNSTDEKIREKLLKELDDDREKFYEKLKQIDSKTYETISINDTQRLVRAMEYYMITGKPISAQSPNKKLREDKYILIGLNYKDRNKLYENIELRVDKMVEMGLLKEAKLAYEKNSNMKSTSAAAQMIGHKEFYKYFENKMSLDDAINLLKQKTRNYAKRQLTWFRKYKTADWIYLDDKSEEDILNEIIEVVKRKDES